MWNRLKETKATNVQLLRDALSKEAAAGKVK